MRFIGRLASDTAMYSVKFKDAAEHSWHKHLNDELIVVAQGSIQQFTGNAKGVIEESKILKAGSAVLLPAGTWHSAKPLEEETLVILTIKGRKGLYRAIEIDGKIIDGPPERGQ